MKIQSVEISRYRAFYGTETLHFGGKNVFIYGENGSGKSSLYYALKDFFKSKRESVDFASVENIFLDDSDQGSGKVQVNFKPEGGARNTEKTYSISARGNSLGSNNDVIIDDANKLKSFLTYKHLLGIHNVKRGDAINLFDLLVNGVLQHFKYSLTDGKELGELWTELNQEISKSTDRTYPINRKRTVVNGILRKFNTAFSELFNPESPEYILRNIEPILDTFGHNVEIQLTYPQLRPTDDYFQLENKRVDIQVKYVGKDIAEPHLFLNEARLSAIAISIYLSMIKRHPQLIEYKILFLDDIFLGLDIGNRLPLLKILDEHFSDYQIFITTYDKPWFEYAKTYLEQNSGWKTMEFYAQPTIQGYQIPCILDNSDLLNKAKHHLSLSDYKATAVYTRSAFEKIIRNYCDKKRIKVTYHSQQKKYTSEDFWNAIKENSTLNLTEELITKVERYRDLVLNAFSHYNTEKHEIRSELTAAIETMRELKSALSLSR